MAGIVVGAYAVRFPMAGYLSLLAPWLLGFRRLGHRVLFVEKAGWPDACFDPRSGTMGDDCSHGTRVVSDFLGRCGFNRDWCFVDAGHAYHGLSRRELEARLAGADLFVDLGTHGTWADETEHCLRVLVDGEPGFRQMRMELEPDVAEMFAAYDRYYTVGLNVGTARSTAPTAGKTWGHVCYPVALELYEAVGVEPDAPFTTVMSWQVHEPVEYGGRTYGQKDIEFERFLHLPGRTSAPVEIAITGPNVPRERLVAAGWRLRDAHDVTRSFDSWRNYLASSLGEFSVAKNVFVALRTGWFSDRSGAYLASGRPVVLQDTGFADHLPLGEGLFAVRDVDDATAAMEEIGRDWFRHSRAARAIAEDHLAAERVLARFLAELGL